MTATKPLFSDWRIFPQCRISHYCDFYRYNNHDIYATACGVSWQVPYVTTPVDTTKKCKKCEINQMDFFDLSFEIEIKRNINEGNKTESQSFWKCHLSAVFP